jgi:transposase-like protein
METVDPKSLQEAVVCFANPANCLAYLVPRRWENGAVICPICGSTKVTFQEHRLRWQCATHHPKRQFSVKVGTIFEDSPLGLDKWLPAVWLLTNCKNGVSSWELSRAIDVTQKTAWFMLHRIRLAHQGKDGGKLGGPGKEIEADESFIGGEARNMHASVKARKITGTGGKDKTIVMGILERGGKVRTKVIANRKKKTVQAEVREHVEAGSEVFTDALKSYEGLAEYAHQVIDHAEAYVDGKVHTNGLENFWSLLKRGLNGTYVSVEPFHLFRYLDEQMFRYNNRKGEDGKPITDAKRFDLAIRQIVGKRVAYAELIGRTSQPAEAF